LAIDDAHRSWHRKRYGSDIDPITHVVPVEKALQEGHPEAGALWEKIIVGILEVPELGFTSSTHERNLYRGDIDGELVLVCHQVDDFAVASTSLPRQNLLPRSMPMPPPEVRVSVPSTTRASGFITMVSTSTKPATTSS
jgi:hypothetical protein